MKNFIIAFKLTLALALLCTVVYPLTLLSAARLVPGQGEGATTSTAHYPQQIGQKFSSAVYFWSRPAAAKYHADASAGSNKGPDNPEYLQLVAARADTFLAHHPGVARNEIPVDLLTASGSGLDPHISPQAAFIQVNRIALARNLPPAMVKQLVLNHTEGPLFGLLGPSRVHVLRLNLALDALESTQTK